MTAIASDVKHLYMHRRQGQTLIFDVQGTRFVIQMGHVNADRRQATLNIIAPPEVVVTRGERLAEIGAHA